MNGIMAAFKCPLAEKARYNRIEHLKQANPHHVCDQQSPFSSIDGGLLARLVLGRWVLRSLGRSYVPSRCSMTL